MHLIQMHGTLNASRACSISLPTNKNSCRRKTLCTNWRSAFVVLSDFYGITGGYLLCHHWPLLVVVKSQPVTFGTAAVPYLQLVEHREASLHPGWVRLQWVELLVP
mmetsp:Transcript_7932/g.12999  ORF Transcript_7932/g.12999 Transcript_7932/m.12999 type:complete len:106 (-) Transcript_7932:808-1125(-)